MSCYFTSLSFKGQIAQEQHTCQVKDAFACLVHMEVRFQAHSEGTGAINDNEWLVHTCIDACGVCAASWVAAGWCGLSWLLAPLASSATQY